MKNAEQGTVCRSPLFGKTRCAVLALLYLRPERTFYFQQILRETGCGAGALQRELLHLSDAGVIEQSRRGNQVHYRADAKCPAFAEIRGLMVKTAGLVDVLRDALTPLKDRIRVAFVFGSFARGEQRGDSDVDVLVVGDASFTEISSATGTTPERLGREINAVVFPVPEFRRKVRTGHHFIADVLRHPKFFILGDEHDLAEVAGRRTAGDA